MKNYLLIWCVKMQVVQNYILFKRVITIECGTETAIICCNYDNMQKSIDEAEAAIARKLKKDEIDAIFAIILDKVIEI